MIGFLMIVDEQIKSNQKPTRVEDDVGLLLLQYKLLFCISFFIPKRNSDPDVSALLSFPTSAK